MFFAGAVSSQVFVSDTLFLALLGGCRWLKFSLFIAAFAKLSAVLRKSLLWFVTEDAGTYFCDPWWFLGAHSLNEREYEAEDEDGRLDPFVWDPWWFCKTL